MWHMSAFVHNGSPAEEMCGPEPSKEAQSLFLTWCGWVSAGNGLSLLGRIQAHGHYAKMLAPSVHQAHTQNQQHCSASLMLARP